MPEIICDRCAVLCTQRMREVINDKDMEIKMLKEGSAIQQHASLLGQQFEEAKLELQVPWAGSHIGVLVVQCVLGHDAD